MTKHFELKKIFTEFFNKNKSKSRSFIKNKFSSFDVSKRSLDRWLSLLYSGKSLDRKIGSGRTPKIATKSTIRKVKNHFNHQSGRSQRKFAKLIGCH